MALLKKEIFNLENIMSREKKQVAEVILFTLACYLYNFKTIKIVDIVYGLQTCGESVMHENGKWKIRRIFHCWGMKNSCK